jgi:predicted Zn-dependent peptidase
MGPAEGAVRRLMEDWAPRSNRKLPSLVLASRAPEAGVPVLTTARPGARQTVATFGCAVPVTSGEDLAALRVLGERIAMRLHQTSRVVLGATYGFSHTEEVKRGIGELRVTGALEERGLTRVLALLRREATTLGTQPLARDEFDRVRWREGIKSNARMQHAMDLGLALADVRLSGLPTDTFERYPAVLQKLSLEDVNRVAGDCRKNVVINLLGEQATVEKAVRATGS